MSGSWSKTCFVLLKTALVVLVHGQVNENFHLFSVKLENRTCWTEYFNMNIHSQTFNDSMYVYFPRVLAVESGYIKGPIVCTPVSIVTSTCDVSN